MIFVESKKVPNEENLKSFLLSNLDETQFMKNKSEEKNDLTSGLDSFFESEFFKENHKTFTNLVSKTFNSLKENGSVFFAKIHEFLQKRKSSVSANSLKMVFKISLDIMYKKYNPNSDNEKICLDSEGFKFFCMLLETYLRRTQTAKNANSFLLINLFALKQS